MCAECSSPSFRDFINHSLWLGRTSLRSNWPQIIVKYMTNMHFKFAFTDVPINKPIDDAPCKRQPVLQLHLTHTMLN